MVVGSGSLGCGIEVSILSWLQFLCMLPLGVSILYDRGVSASAIAVSTRSVVPISGNSNFDVLVFPVYLGIDVDCHGPLSALP